MVRGTLLYGLFGILVSVANGQTLRQLTTLSSEVQETSGLLYLEGKVFTHNDSGGTEKLYELDPANGDVVGDVFVLNATATDWEDLCADEAFIYVGDFGNNDGTRTNLRIYKIPIVDFLDGNSTAEATELDFNYRDQTVFDSRRFSTNYDAETLISYGDSLLIFSKNWGNRSSSVYSVAKDFQGEQALAARAVFPFQGLITGGVYDEENERILLVGYDFIVPFVIVIETDGTYDFSHFPWTKYDLDTQGGTIQIEGISLAGDGTYYLSGERTDSSSPMLYSFSLASTSSIRMHGELVPAAFPNPARQELTMNSADFLRADLFDLTGKRVKTTTSRKMNVQELPRGAYTLRLQSSSGEKTISKIVLQ